jgi:uncharacterized membrane protein YjjP (DUF1212 family)
MNYGLLLELATTLGYRLAMSGAETFRIEESILRILKTYGLEAEAFAIPNCLTVSIITADGTPMTRMRRIGYHGNDLDAVERYSNLSRRICAQCPAPETAMQWLEDTTENLTHYSPNLIALGYFLGSFGFSPIFGGTFADALWAGLCGLVVMGIDRIMDRLHATLFFRTITSAFFSALIAYSAHSVGFLDNPDAAIIGTLMLLVPGLLFTNAMRDIMYGDTNSGLHRIVQVLLIAVAIVLGTAAAWQMLAAVSGVPVGSGLIDYNFLQLNIAAFIACVGFAILFNIHGMGITLCAIGGVLAWSAYLLVMELSGNLYFANLVGGIVASVYSETMARIRKYPAISYLVVSIFPLIPGAGVYYTMNYCVQGHTQLFAEKSLETAAVAGSIALGILLISTAFRMWSSYFSHKKHC